MVTLRSTASSLPKNRMILRLVCRQEQSYDKIFEDILWCVVKLRYYFIFHHAYMVFCRVSEGKVTLAGHLSMLSYTDANRRPHNLWPCIGKNVENCQVPGQLSNLPVISLWLKSYGSSLICDHSMSVILWLYHWLPLLGLMWVYWCLKSGVTGGKERLNRNTGIDHF